MVRYDLGQILASLPIFASLSEAELHDLVGRCVCREVAQGEMLFRKGDQCHGLHIVITGRIRSYRANSTGQEQVLHVLGPGDLLGEVAVFDEGPYLRSARSVEKGRVLFIPMSAVQRLFRTNPRVAEAVVRELGSRVRTLASLVDQLSLRDVPARVAAAILHYADEADALRQAGSFRLPRTQEELADEVGTTREGVARALRGLRESNIVRQQGARVEILDLERLAEVAGQVPGVH